MDKFSEHSDNEIISENDKTESDDQDLSTGDFQSGGS